MSLTSEILDGRALVIDWALVDVLLGKNKFLNAGTLSASLLAWSLNGNFNQDYSNNLWLKVYFPVFSTSSLLLRIFYFRTKGQGLPTLKFTHLLIQLTKARSPLTRQDMASYHGLITCQILQVKIKKLVFWRKSAEVFQSKISFLWI